jgi:hypothetical protein
VVIDSTGLDAAAVTHAMLAAVKERAKRPA